MQDKQDAVGRIFNPNPVISLASEQAELRHGFTEILKELAILKARLAKIGESSSTAINEPKVAKKDWKSLEELFLKMRRDGNGLNADQELTISRFINES